MEPTFAMRWFYSNLAGKQVQQGNKACAVCGLTMVEAKSRKQVLRQTFTNYDLLREHVGQDICSACTWYFDHQELRRSGWYLTAGEAMRLKKSEWLPLLRQHIIAGVPRDAYYLIKPLGLTGKHLALYAQMTMAGNHAVDVQFNTMHINIDLTFLDLVEASHYLRKHHSWKEIRTGNYYAKHILNWASRSEFVRLRNDVQPWLRTAELSLSEFLWSSEESK